MPPRPAWHRHHNVKCNRCGVLIWPQVTCATRVRRKKCRIPKIATCPGCRQAEVA